jgi:hypothetical protein
MLPVLNAYGFEQVLQIQDFILIDILNSIAYSDIMYEEFPLYMIMPY